MRCFLLYILSIVITTNAFSQNWKTVPMKDTVYFSSANKVLKVIWIESVNQAGTDSVFNFYKSIRDTSYATSCIDSLADTWLGKSFVRNNNGDEFISTHFMIQF